VRGGSFLPPIRTLLILIAPSRASQQTIARPQSAPRNPIGRRRRRSRYLARARPTSRARSSDFGPATEGNPCRVAPRRTFVSPAENKRGAASAAPKFEKPLVEWGAERSGLLQRVGVTRLAPDMYGAHMKFNLHFLHAAERVTPGAARGPGGERINIGAPSNARSDRDSLRQKAETEPRISGNFSDPPSTRRPGQRRQRQALQPPTRTALRLYYIGCPFRAPFHSGSRVLYEHFKPSSRNRRLDRGPGRIAKCRSSTGDLIEGRARRE